MTFTRDHLNQTEQNYLSKAYRFEKSGWIFLHIEGAPFERGFQHGYLLAKELDQALKTIKFTSRWDTGDTFDFFKNAAIYLYDHWLNDELYHFHKIVLQLVGIICVSPFPNIRNKNVRSCSH